MTTNRKPNDKAFVPLLHPERCPLNGQPVQDLSLPYFLSYFPRVDDPMFALVNVSPFNPLP